MNVIPWVGARRVAIVPVIDLEVDREPPPDWQYQVYSRAFYDPEPGTGMDQSFQHYLQALSYGRAFLEGEVFPLVRAPNAEVNIPAMKSLPAGHGYEYLLAVLPHEEGEHRNGIAFPHTPEVNGITGWARVAMFTTRSMGVRQGLGVWGQELFHLLCELLEHPNLPGYDPMDGDGARRSVHASATTKRLFGWLPQGIVDHVGSELHANLHAIGLAQPPPPDRVTAVRIPSRLSSSHFFVEARLRTDPFDGAIPKEGVLVYKVSDTVKVDLLNPALDPGQTFQDADEGLRVTVDTLLTGGFAVRIESTGQRLIDRTEQIGARAAASPPCALAVGDIQDIAYRDTTAHLNEIWRDLHGVGTTDLTENAQAPTAQGTPFFYFDPAGNQVVLLFRGSDNHVRSLYWMFGSVGHDDLTGSINAPGTVGDPAGWFSTHDGFHHVVYRSNDAHLRELWWQGQGGVGHGDLTAAGQAVAAAGDPWPYYDPVRSTNIVTFRGTDRHIRSLYWAPDGAVGQDDLSGVAGTPGADGDPFAWFTSADDSHHVVYRASNGHLYELFWYNVAPVQGRDLTALSGAPPAVGEVSGGYNPADNAHHVIFRSGDGRLHELWYFLGQTEVGYGDLTAAFNAPGAADRPFYFASSRAPHQHVAYRGSNGHIYEMLW